MGTVNVNGTNYTVYGTLAACDAHINGAIGPGYDEYNALTNDDTKGRLLVGASRYIDRQTWIATADTIAERDALLAFQQAAYELAAMGAADPSVFANADQGQNISEMGAGSARIAFFAPTSTRRGTATKLPTLVNDLVGAYLVNPGGAIATVGPLSSGTDGESSFDDCDGYKRNGAF